MKVHLNKPVLAVALFLMIAAFSANTQQQPAYFQNIEFPGNDIGFSYVSSPDQCQANCNTTVAVNSPNFTCAAWTVYPSNTTTGQYVCYLKYAITSMRVPANNNSKTINFHY
jgi:hypothetical protein